MRAYHERRGDTKRTKVLIPDSAHGTNPASSVMSGFSVVQIPSDARGNVDLEALRRECDDTVVGFMLTNPNTLGLFEEHVLEVCETIHACGGLMYGDGANLNAILGIVRPGDLGFDVMHFNLHKTFTTPHGGGGPGSGPVGVSARLAPFLPGPIVVKQGEAYGLSVPDQSIGRVKAFHGNYGMFIRAYTYIRMMGPDGLRAVSENAVLNANYLKAKLSGHFAVAVDRPCMHEFVVHGDIPGTDVDIPYDDVDAIEKYLAYDHCADVLLVCKSGGMSLSAGNELIKRGYLRVRDLAGGMDAWQKAGYPLLKDGGV